MLEPNQYIFGSKDYAIGEILRRATLQYELYLYLISVFKEQYERLKKYSVFNGRMVFNDDRGGRLIVEEYFLWLFNNDHMKLTELLQEFGSYLVENYFGWYQDIFSYPEKELNEIVCKSPSEETKSLVMDIIGNKLSKEREYRRSGHSFSNTSGMYNTLTGEVIKPNDGTYYIDDFR